MMSKAGLAITIISWLFGVFLAYGAVRSDVAVLQVKYDFVQQQLQEIRDTQKAMDHKIDSLLATIALEKVVK